MDTKNKQLIVIEPAQCPVEATLRIVGGKWKTVILFYLMDGTKRFGELKHLISGITQKMLTAQLRELENDKVIRRKVYREVPPHVEYSMTEFGKSLAPVLKVMNDWGDTYNQQIKKKNSKN